MQHEGEEGQEKEEEGEENYKYSAAAWLKLVRS
jgi:hypothetical protein